MKFLENRILEFHPDTMETVLKSCNLHRPGEISNAIDILEEWINQQNHFTKKNFSREYLQIAIIAVKGSVERAKSRMDKLFTYKTMMPQYFGSYDLRNDFMELDGTIQYGILSKLTENHNRVIVAKSCGQKFEPTHCLHVGKCLFMLAEYFKAQDYSHGYIGLMDYRGINFREQIPNINLVDVRQISTILQEGYGVKVEGLHFLNSPSILFETVVNIYKQFMPEKIRERIKIHNSIESVHEFIPKDILPKDYGGEQKSLAEHHEDLVELTRSKDFREHLTEMSEARTDESLRPADSFNDLYMGTPGTFRTLNVD